MISPKKYFVIFILSQILAFLIILSFIIFITWNPNGKSSPFIHHDNNFNLTVDHKFELRYLELPQRKEILCFVTTMPENNFARSAIRKTWGKIIKPIFLLPKIHEKFETSLENESNVFGDMIVIDEQLELSKEEEIFFSVKFFSENFNTSKYFMITNDNEFINPQKLFNLLNRDEYHGIIWEKIYYWSFIKRIEEITLLIVPGNDFF